MFSPRIINIFLTRVEYAVILKINKKQAMRPFPEQEWAFFAVKSPGKLQGTGLSW